MISGKALRLRALLKCFHAAHAKPGTRLRTQTRNRDAVSALCTASVILGGDAIQGRVDLFQLREIVAGDRHIHISQCISLTPVSGRFKIIGKCEPVRLVLTMQMLVDALNQFFSALQQLGFQRVNFIFWNSVLRLCFDFY